MTSITGPVGRLLALLILGPVISVTGCGQKGALYLPGGDPSEMQSIVPEPATPPTGGQADEQATDDDEESESSEDDTGTTT